MAEQELNNYKARMETNQKKLITEVDKADEMKKMKGIIIESKTPPEGEEGDTL